MARGMYFAPLVRYHFSDPYMMFAGSCWVRMRIYPQMTAHITGVPPADTDRLHRKINEMSERIRQLEDALGILQSSCGKSPHPLLREDLMKIKSTIDLHSASGTGTPATEPDSHESQADDSESRDTDRDIDSHGTMTVRDYGMYDVASFYGRSAGSDVRCSRLSSATPCNARSLQAMLVVRASISRSAACTHCACADREDVRRDALVDAQQPSRRNRATL